MNVGLCKLAVWVVECLASGSRQFAQPYIHMRLRLFRCEHENVTDTHFARNKEAARNELQNEARTL